MATLTPEFVAATSWVRVGTAIDAQSPGDLGAGSVGAARFFYDESLAQLTLFDSGGLQVVQCTASANDGNIILKDSTFTRASLAATTGLRLNDASGVEQIRLDNAGAVTVGVSGSGSITVPGAGLNSEQFGSGAVAGGADSVAIGNSAVATASTSTVVIGRSTVGGIANNVVVGANASPSSQSDCVVIGASALGQGNSVTVIGKSASSAAGSVQNVVIGTSASVSLSGTATSNNNNVVIGASANVDIASGSTGSAVVVGYAASAATANNVAIGSGASAAALYTTVIGAGASATGGSSTAIGRLATAAGTGTVAIQGTTGGNYNVAIGGTAGSGATNDSTAVGALSSAGREAVALGRSAIANSQGQVAVGSGAVASGGRAFAFGRSTVAAFTDSMVFGAGAVATANNQLVFGTSDVNGNYRITEMVLGQGPEQATLNSLFDVTIRPTDRITATDVPGQNLVLRSGKGTGAAAGSTVTIQTPDPGATGAVQQTLVTRLAVNSSGATVTGDLTVTGTISGGAGAAAAFGYLNVGTTTLANATGELASGTPTNSMFYDPVANSLTFDSNGGVAEITSDLSVYVHSGTGGALFLRSGGPGAQLFIGDAATSQIRLGTTLGDGVTINDKVNIGPAGTIGDPPGGPATSQGDVRLTGNLYAQNALNVGLNVTQTTADGDIYAGSAARQFRWDESTGIGLFHQSGTIGSPALVGLPLTLQSSAAVGTNSGLSIISGTSGLGEIIFGDTADSIKGALAYDNSLDALRFYANDDWRWRITSAGHLLTELDNAYDIGANAATRPRTVYVGTSLNVGVAASTASGNVTAGDGTNTLTWDASGNTLITGGSATTPAVIRAATGAGTGTYASLQTLTDQGGTPRGADLTSYSSTYTTAATYDLPSSGVLNASAQLTNGLILNTFGSAPIRFATSTGFAGNFRWQISATGHLLGETDNTYDIGASGASRPRTGYFGTSVVVGNTITITTDSISGSNLTLNGTTGFMNLGAATSATALGDLSAGDGTRELVWDGSTGDFRAGQGSGASGGHEIRWTGASNPNLAIDYNATSATENRTLLRLNAYRAAGSASGFGSGIVFNSDDNGGVLRTHAIISAAWDDPSPTNLSGSLDFRFGHHTGVFLHIPTVARFGDWDGAGMGFSIRDNSGDALSNRERLRMNADTGVMEMYDGSANTRVQFSDTGFANIGATTTASALGDFAVGDGTRELSWDASAGTLTTSGAGAGLFVGTRELGLTGTSMQFGGAIAVLQNVGSELMAKAGTLVTFLARRGSAGSAGTTTIELEVNGTPTGDTLSWANTDADFTLKSTTISQAVSLGDRVSFRITAAETGASDILAMVA